MNDIAEYDRYSVIIEWDPVDEIYVVTVPELPGCMTHGATMEEASKQAQDAIESWIDAARRWARPLPEPRYFDIDCSSYIEHVAIDSYQSGKAS